MYNSLNRLTQSDLSKGDRTRVMVCITMDAHGRDVVQKMAREGVTTVGESFPTFASDVVELMGTAHGVLHLEPRTST